MSSARLAWARYALARASWTASSASSPTIRRASRYRRGSSRAARDWKLPRSGGVSAACCSARTIPCSGKTLTDWKLLHRLGNAISSDAAASLPSIWRIRPPTSKEEDDGNADRSQPDRRAGDARDGRMTTDVGVDVELLKSEIKKTYSSVSEEPERDFIFPTGRAWAEDLGYPDELANVPESAVESFAGVANPWTMGRLRPGERVLDLGSGAGTDSLIAAQMVGEEGSVTGIDMTPQMLAKARAAAATMGATNVEFVEAEAESLPFPDASFDLVISNGVIDLIPDKDAVFAELHRVLRPGGRIQIADVTIQNPVSEEGRRKIDLWTG